MEQIKNPQLTINENKDPIWPQSADRCFSLCPEQPRLRHRTINGELRSSAQAPYAGQCPLCLRPPRSRWSRRPPKIYGTLDPEGGVFIEDIKDPSLNLDRFLWVEFNRDPASVRWAAEIEFTTIEPIRSFARSPIIDISSLTDALLVARASTWRYCRRRR